MESKRAGAVIVLLTPARQARKVCGELLVTAVGKVRRQSVTMHAVLTDDGPQSSAIKDAVSETFGHSLTLSSVRNNVGSAFLTFLRTDNAGPAEKTQVCDIHARHIVN